ILTTVRRLRYLLRRRTAIEGEIVWNAREFTHESDDLVTRCCDGGCWWMMEASGDYYRLTGGLTETKLCFEWQPTRQPFLDEAPVGFQQVQPVMFDVSTEVTVEPHKETGAAPTDFVRHVTGADQSIEKPSMVDHQKLI
ncbi:hypothetical protein M8C21_028890, partial [Ambrosia artemisiifolia]